MRARAPGDEARGQVLVLFAILIMVLLAAAGLSIDIGRQVAERRHIQTAADAAALAACRALIDGASDAAAATEARTVARDQHRGLPERHRSADRPRLVPGLRGWARGRPGVPGLGRADQRHERPGRDLAPRWRRRSRASSGYRRSRRTPAPAASSRAARRCRSSRAATTGRPGRAAGFTDFLATAATSTSGQVDTFNVLGYDTRTPASETSPGPVFDLYGPHAKASNDSAFRGFVALDVRNFESTTSRIYYNGVAAGTNVQTLKNMEGDYIADRLPGPDVPADHPAGRPERPGRGDGGQRHLDGASATSARCTRSANGSCSRVYSGTVMQIPDFAITPPTAITLPGTTASPQTGPNFTVTRNDAFKSTVTLHLRGDTGADALHPEFDIVPNPSVTPPLAGHMDEPTWSTDVFIPAKNGTRVTMQSISTNSVPAGIYTVWLEGQSGNPYFQTRRTPVPVFVGGAARDFSLANSTTSGDIASLGGSLSIPIYVSTTNASGTKWSPGGSGDHSTPVALSVDASSFTDCSLNAAVIGPGQLTLSAPSVTPSSSGSGALSTLTISSVGLAPGCYRFNLRAYGTNGDDQPVVHIQPITFTVATTASDGSYVDVIGFAVFEVTDVSANSISGRAVSAVAADPNDASLRRAENARLIPW